MLPSAIAGVIGDGRVLLLLDNCEHLTEACAYLSEELLQSTPVLRILATSRASLGLAGEVVWKVPGLTLPHSPDGQRLLGGGTGGPACSSPNEAGERTGFAALELFLLRAGSFCATFGEPAAAAGPELSVSALLMEACRKRDEAAARSQ